jgi:hypothetical protein
MSTQMPATLRSGVLLHTFLMIGVLSIQVIIGGLYWKGVAPLSPAPWPTASILALVGIVSLGFGILARGRVPQPVRRVTMESHWTRPETFSAALRVWYLLEVAPLSAP